MDGRTWRRGGLPGALAGVIGALALPGAALAGAPTWTPIETLTLPTDRANPPSVVTIDRSDGYRHPLRVTIRRPSGAPISDMFGEGLVPLKDGVAPSLAATNRLRSDYVFVSPKLDRLPGRRVLMLFGGPSPPTLALMIVGARDYETYAGGIFVMTEIVRRPGGVRLIGRRDLGRPLTRCRTTYAPYAVLVFVGAKDSSLDYSPALSRAYNRDHYVWAGPRARRDLAVDVCSARPRLVTGPAS